MALHNLTLNPTARRSHFAKNRRPYLEPISDAKNNPHFEKPPLTNNVNLTLPLRVVVPPEAQAAANAKKLVFHVIGDSDAIHGDDTPGPLPQAMDHQIKPPAPATHPPLL